MVMVITGPNCEQWNYEISKFAATVFASTSRPFLLRRFTSAGRVSRDRQEEKLNFNDRYFGTAVLGHVEQR